MLSRQFFRLQNALRSHRVRPVYRLLNDLQLPRCFASCPSVETTGIVAPTVRFPYSERNTMYRYLMLNKNYRKTIAFLDFVRENFPSESVDTILSRDLSKLENHEVIEYMKKVVHVYAADPAKLREPSFVEFCERFLDRVPTMLDEQLLNVLKILTLWQRSQEGNDNLFYRICKTIDDEFLKRIRLYGRDQMLLTMDHFYRLNVLNYSSFLWEGMKRICRKPSRLTPSQLVHTLFLVQSHRKWHPAVDFFEWEQTLISTIYELSAEEVAVVALGFFKTNQRITNPELLNGIMVKLETRVDTLDSVCLAALLKIIRFSILSDMRHRFLDIQDKLKDVVDQHSISTCVHMGLLATRQPMLNSELLSKLFLKFVPEISTVRLKEIERMLFIASMFNYNPNTDPDFFAASAKELKNRVEETRTYFRSFIYAVQFLCVKGVFDYDLMNRVLSNGFLLESFKEISKYTIPCNILEIDCCAKLDCPDYDGNTLDTDMLNEIGSFLNAKSQAVKNKLLSKRDKIYYQCKLRLEELFANPRCVHIAHVLPYSNSPQIIFCLKDGKPIDIPEDILEKHYVDFKPASKIGDWHAIELMGPGAEIGNTGQPIGSMLSKLRHLKLLGYKRILLNESRWNHISTDKVKLLKNLIQISS